MNYEEKLREIINSNSPYYPSEDRNIFAKYFPELKEIKDKSISIRKPTQLEVNYFTDELEYELESNNDICSKELKETLV